VAPALAALAMAALLAACSKEEKAPAGAAPQGMPPATVGVLAVQPQAVALQIELPGRVEPVRVAQVRARVNGVVLKRLFREGSEVRAGQPLFTIDPAPYKASVDSAEATLQRAQANLTQAAAQADRYKPLVEANAVSKQDYINATAAQKQAEADVAAGKAAVQSARINLGYAQVTAPIAGRIGRALVTEGALVSATEATQLALVQQTSTVYVNFTQSANEVQRLRKAMAAGQLRSAGAEAAEVRIVQEDGSVLPRTGRLLFSDLTVDATTGQITLRAEVPNADNALLPGQYVRVRLAQAELPNGFLVPQQAVTRSNQGDTVLVVGADKKPARRTIKIGSSQGNSWVVTDGLAAGDQVIVDGFQKMMVPGAPVNPVPWAGPASAPASGASGVAASVPASAPAPTASASASAGK
jgi:membrane fusion protein (multidrug efflux system)